MNTTVKHLSDTKVELTITVDATALAAAEKIALTKLSKTVKVDGFRKGKVPAGVAAKHVDPQALQEQLLDDAISKAVAESFLAEKIQALDRPSVEIKKYVPSDLLEFTAEVEVLPNIKLGDYKKLKTKVEKITVPESDVTDVIKRMRQGFAEKKEVTRAAKDGDETSIDFVGKKEGIAFDGGTGTGYTLTLGSHQFIPGFEEGIVGHKAGETFDLELTFPEEYHAKDLAGQKVVFTVTLNKVLEPQLPELDEAFAKKAGPFTSMQELQNDIKREITEQKTKEADDKRKNDLIDELIEKSTVPTPNILVADHMQSIEQDFAQNLQYRGLDLHTYLESNGFTDEANWREKEVKPAAERRVKAGLVLSEVTKLEKLEVSDAEIEAELDRYRKQYANSPDTLKQLETPEVRRDIANQVLTRKAVERVAELNS